MIQLVFLLECLVAHLEENLVLELGASIYLICSEPPPPIYLFILLCDLILLGYIVMVFSVTYYLKLHNTPIFY